MEWWLVLLIIFGLLVLLFMIGVPIAFSFLLIDLIGVFIFWRGEAGLSQLILSIYESVTNFNLLPIPLLSLGNLCSSRMAPKMMDVLDKWLGVCREG
jgi:TRAP-type mannitol/chloroaromatic compound transport system permease large subunit